MYAMLLSIITEGYLANVRYSNKFVFKIDSSGNWIHRVCITTRSSLHHNNGTRQKHSVMPYAVNYRHFSVWTSLWFTILKDPQLLYLCGFLFAKNTKHVPVYTEITKKPKLNYGTIKVHLILRIYIYLMRLCYFYDILKRNISAIFYETLTAYGNLAQQNAISVIQWCTWKTLPKNPYLIRAIFEHNENALANEKFCLTNPDRPGWKSLFQR